MRKTFVVAILMAGGVLYAQTPDSVSQAKLDSIDAKFKMQKLKEISISAPKPVYSMTGEVVNYNVENDETVLDLTAWDAIRNAPTVEVDVEGNISMRGSEKVEVWLNGRPTGMEGPTLRAFFESMPADALARIEVIKNPSAKYMVAQDRHILNIVTSARLRTSELLIVGLSGNSRPYVSPWFSYVRNTDRLRFSFHLAGSTSNFRDDGTNTHTLFDGDDTTSMQHYSYESVGPSYFGSNNFNIGYTIDSANEITVFSWNSMQGRYRNRTLRDYEQWDYRPDTAHYRYMDSSESGLAIVNGFTTFDLKHRFATNGHNLSLGVTWNYLSNVDHLLQQRTLLLADGIGSLPLTPFDRRTEKHRRNNTIDITLNYNRPLGAHDELRVRIGGRPYANSHSDVAILDYDTSTFTYSRPDLLRNHASNDRSQRLYASTSWRHEWERTTLTADMHLNRVWLHISDEALFADDTLFRFFTLGPSLTLTHRTPSMHYVRLGLSHSTNLPTGRDLTTSRTYGTDSYSTGNRALHPSSTWKSNLSWNRYFERIGNIGIDAYYNTTLGGIESVVASTSEVDPWLGRIVTYTMPMNIASSFRYGVDANVTLRPKAWCNLSLNASLYRSGYDVEDELPQRLTSWRISARLWTKIAKVVDIEASTNYGNPSLDLYSQQKNNLTVGLGLSSTLLDGRLSLRAYINDLFDSNRTTSTTAAPSYSAIRSSHYYSRYITFGITYRIGKLNLQYQAMEGAAMQ